MNEEESRYLQRVEAVIESFGVIQKEFVLNKDGIVAVIDLIKKYSINARTRIEPEDPVLQKGKSIVSRVIQKLKGAFSQLEKTTPPELWSKFHKTLINSMVLQIKGYEIMFKTFTDYNISNIIKGKDIVDKGIKILEGGKKSEK